MNLIRVDCKQRFLIFWQESSSRKKKRKLMALNSLRFWRGSQKTGDNVIFWFKVPFILTWSKAVVKCAGHQSHHNVGGLLTLWISKKFVEPLRDLFKDEVRKLGLELGIPEFLVFRQPFRPWFSRTYYWRYYSGEDRNSSKCRRNFPWRTGKGWHC